MNKESTQVFLEALERYISIRLDITERGPARNGRPGPGFLEAGKELCDAFEAAVREATKAQEEPY